MYDKFPYIRVSDDEADCSLGWSEIGAAIRHRITSQETTICVECYPGTFLDSIVKGLSAELAPSQVLVADSCYLQAEEIESKFRKFITDDPVFGRMNSTTIDDFLDGSKVDEA